MSIGMIENDNPKTSVTYVELIEAMDLMKKVNFASEKILDRYGTMLEFIDSKGLMNEWEDYFLDHFLSKQNPSGN